MQLIGDGIVGLLLVLFAYKLFVKFGWWVEKRAEKAIDEVKKEK